MKKEPGSLTPAVTASPRTLTRVFWVMLKIGALTFGGGYAMIPQMSRDFVDRHHWITSDEITDLLSVAQTLPGVMAVNAAILVGYRVSGFPGAAAAALGAVLPSFLILSAVTPLYHALIDNATVLAAMKGLRAAVAGLLLSAVFRLWTSSVRKVSGVVLFLAGLAVTVFLPSLNLIYVILGGGLGGILLSLPRRIRQGRAAAERRDVHD